MMFRLFLQFAFTSRRILWLIVLWQFISVLLMALGVWPEWVIWFNLALTVLFLLLTDTHDGLLLLIASIPFYVAIPNRYFASLPTWRVLFIALFLIWLGRTFAKRKQYLSQFLPWDRYLALFLLACLLSVIFARFPAQAVKQIIFLANAYLLYVVLIHTTTTREKVIDLIKYAAASATIIVAIGYIQFIATLFVPPYYFWQYWAVMVSRLYYGLPLANVLIYSNSWFTYTGGLQELRMFSIMPDSHSFGMVAVFCIGFLLALVAWYKPANKMAQRPFLGIFATRNYYVWYMIRFSGLAVVLSGTRGVWVGMGAPLVVSAYLYLKKFARPMMKKIVVAELLIILFFILSPFINYGLNLFRVAQFKENFLQRAQSIYDLREDSNVGRLIIWRDSLAYSATHPFGVGYGNFVVSVVRDIPPGTSFSEVASQKNLRYNLPQKFVTAHSLYLNILVELGFAGLLVFVIFWWSYGRAVWRFIKRYRDQENIFTMFVVSIAFTMMWFLVYGIFDVTLFNDKVLMYFFISLGITGIILRRYGSFDESRADNGVKLPAEKR